MMDWIFPLTAVAGGILFGAMSPGPSFVIVARTAMAISRKNGMAAALGMGLGGGIFAAAAVLGLIFVLTSVPLLFVVLKAVGAAYLFYLAYKIWTAAKEPLDFGSAATGPSTSLGRSFFLGLTTQLSNPKTAIVYASIFAVALPADAPSWFGLACVGLIFTIEAGWYGLVALVLSFDKPRKSYMKSKAVLDRSAASVMGLLGLKVISDIR